MCCFKVWADAKVQRLNFRVWSSESAESKVCVWSSILWQTDGRIFFGGGGQRWITDLLQIEQALLFGVAKGATRRIDSIQLSSTVSGGQNRHFSTHAAGTRSILQASSLYDRSMIFVWSLCGLCGILVWSLFWCLLLQSGSKSKFRRVALLKIVTISFWIVNLKLTIWQC